MKFLEFRRHSYRGDGDNLSKRGIDYAKKIADDLDHPYDLYISSPKGRAKETLKCFIKDFEGMNIEIMGEFSIFPDIRFFQYDKEILRYQKTNNVDYYEAIFNVNPARIEFEKLFKDTYQPQIIKILNHLPKNGKALIVSHCGTIEPILCSGFPKLSTIYLEDFFEYCEGAKLYFEKDSWPPTKIEFKYLR